MELVNDTHLENVTHMDVFYTQSTLGMQKIVEKYWCVGEKNDLKKKHIELLVNFWETQISNELSKGYIYAIQKVWIGV